MASQTQGIQQLLSAEKRAAEKVSEARKRKNRRLKQAKEEAQAEIEKYKKEREQQVMGYIMDVAQKLAILLNPRVSTSPSKTGIEQREAIILCGKPSAVENVIQADSDDQ